MIYGNQSGHAKKEYNMHSLHAREVFSSVNMTNDHHTYQSNQFGKISADIN